MPKPVCVKCQRFYRPTRNGQAWVEGMPDGCAKPGLAEPEHWHPYKLWIGDEWGCPDCGARIIVGHAREPRSEHYMDGFQELCRAYADRGPLPQINDC